MCKYLTIDLEGDISSKICQQHFTEDTMFRDPNTISWLCSFTSDTGRTRTIGIRLPSQPRKFISLTTGREENTIHGWHNQSNNFGNFEDLLDCGSSENENDYIKFLTNIAQVLNNCYNHNVKVYFKGFKKVLSDGICHVDHYDRCQINTLMKKYNIPCHTEVLVDVFEEFPKFYMGYTISQKHQNTDNQSYMLRAIEHNRQDSELLSKELKKYL